MNEAHDNKPKTVCSVADMARACGLSRARFYQLQREGIFPMPQYDANTRRPFYTEDQQVTCLEVRRRNCGINGKPILFYSRRNGSAVSAPKSRQTKMKLKSNPQHVAVAEGLRSLGLASVTMEQVAAAIKERFPDGIDDDYQAEAIRAVFMHIQRQNRGDNVG